MGIVMQSDRTLAVAAGKGIWRTSLLVYCVGAIIVFALLIIVFFSIQPGPISPTSSGLNRSTAEPVKINMLRLLDGGKFATRSSNVTGGNATAILGGVEIDIREAESQNNTIEIEVISIVGGVEIQVPRHFTVSSRILPILAGVSNSTTYLADKVGAPEKHLIISGVAIMGGVEITN